MVSSIDPESPFVQRFSQALKSVGLGNAMLEADSTEILETVDPEALVTKAAAELRPIVSINLFQHPDAHPIALDLALLRRYGPEWLLWEAETIETRVPIDFKTNSLAALNFEKIMAVKTLHLTDSFWKRWEVFSALQQPLNNAFADFNIMQAPTYGAVVVAADIAGHLRDDVKWSEEIVEYIKVVMRHDGVLVGVEPLQDIGPDMTGYPVDTAMIKAAWSAVRQTDRPPSDDTAEAEQLRQMLAVHRYVEHRRQQLRDQLPLVLSI